MLHKLDEIGVNIEPSRVRHKSTCYQKKIKRTNTQAEKLNTLNVQVWPLELQEVSWFHDAPAKGKNVNDNGTPGKGFSKNSSLRHWLINYYVISYTDQ